MTVKLPIDMPKDCWRCLFGLNDFAREETMCHLIFKLRNDAWDIPKSVEKGKKREDCPLIEVEDDKPLSKMCDVIDLSVNGTRVRIDVDRSGYIRIWSDGNKIKTEENQYSTVSVRLEKNYDSTYKRAD